MAVWRYSGHLMGIPETILFRDEEEALKLYDIGLMCEPDAPIESVVMAHSLVNSAPLIAGMTSPEDASELSPLRVPHFAWTYRIRCCRPTNVSFAFVLWSCRVV